MADYYPRRYFSGYPDYPSAQADYPPPRPSYPPLPRSGYGPDYPPYQSDYPPDRSNYPPRELDPGSKDDVGNKSQPPKVVNKRYRYFGIALIFLSIASLGIEIANVVFTYMFFNVSDPNKVSNPIAVPYILTWIAPGIWGSIPVFVTGILALRIAGRNNNTVRVFGLFCAICAFVFTPAIIGISVAEIVLFPRSTEKPTTPGGTSPCYSFDTPASLICPKFVLPVVEAVLGGIEFYLALMVTITFCLCWKPPPKADNGVTTTTGSSSAAAAAAADSQPNDYPRYPSNSPYSEGIESRQAAYYRSLPPPRFGAVDDYPGSNIVVLPPRGAGAPDMSLLRSYPAYRPATSRGFGMASAMNHRLSYGNYAGTTPASPFYGSMPSLGGLGGPGPNPAYKVVYS